MQLLLHENHKHNFNGTNLRGIRRVFYNTRSLSMLLFTIDQQPYELHYMHFN